MQLKVKKEFGSILHALGAALIPFMLCWAFAPSRKVGLVFAVGYLAAYLLKVKVENRTLGGWLTAALAVISAGLNFFLVQKSLTLQPVFFDMDPAVAGMNVLCYLGILCVLYGLFQSVRAASLVTFLATMLLAAVNFFVIQFRGNELMPVDLLSFRTAANVVGRYQFWMEPEMLYAWLLGGGYLLALFGIQLPPAKTLWSRAIALAAALACALVISGNTDRLAKNTFRMEGSTYNGFLLNFVTQSTGLEKPAEYGEFDMAAAEAYYAPAGQSARQPNILVIMNESFADLRVYGKGFQTDVPVTPFYDSLQEDTVKGYALASIFGGNTANSEYEFLTGNTMGFLPSGAVAYQYFVKDGIWSLTAYLESLGYASAAMHPAYANNWTRATAWEHFGFQQADFIDDFPKQELIRGFVSDREMYGQALQVLADKEPGKPLFLFGVTMQNHGGYDDPDYQSAVALQGLEGTYPGAEQYLTLVQESDAALAYLMGELEKLEEDTIVLFYGDHQPQLETAFFEEIYGGPLDSLEAQQLSFTVPFFIWANYDIPEAELERTSLNYLGIDLLELAGIPLPPYWQFLKDVRHAIPAMNAAGYVSGAAGGWLPYDGATGREKELLDAYRSLQYHSIRGGSKRSQVFFPYAQ